MISYELAKQLKEAGFPQENCVTKNYHPTHGLSFGIPHPDMLIEPEVVSLPTLSELIEACGDRFWKIEYLVPEYKAFSRNPDKSFLGTTMEEALTTLWLELLKK